jgi:hypothetical protein
MHQCVRTGDYAADFWHAQAWDQRMSTNPIVETIIPSFKDDIDQRYSADNKIGLDRLPAGIYPLRRR